MEAPPSRLAKLNRPITISSCSGPNSDIGNRIVGFSLFARTFLLTSRMDHEIAPWALTLLPCYRHYVSEHTEVLPADCPVLGCRQWEVVPGPVREARHQQRWEGGRCGIASRPQGDGDIPPGRRTGTTEVSHEVPHDCTVHQEGLPRVGLFTSAWNSCRVATRHASDTRGWRSLFWSPVCRKSSPLVIRTRTGVWTSTSSPSTWRTTRRSCASRLGAWTKITMVW